MLRLIVRSTAKPDGLHAAWDQGLGTELFQPSLAGTLRIRVLDFGQSKYIGPPPEECRQSTATSVSPSASDEFINFPVSLGLLSVSLSSTCVSTFPGFPGSSHDPFMPPHIHSRVGFRRHLRCQPHFVVSNSK